MNEITVNVNFEKGLCDVTSINLKTSDYNSTKLVFTFDTEDGTKIFKMKNPNDETIFEDEIIDNEVILVGKDENDNNASLFNSEGDYPFEVVLYGEDSRLTSTSNILSVEKVIVNEDDTEIEVYKPLFDTIMEELTGAINEVENIDINVEKVDTTSTITITKKDGTKKEVEVNDGEKGETGETGQDGKDAKINGYNTITIEAGQNITIEQEDNTLTINSTGGGSGTSNYNDLSNKPKINNVELSGNKSTSDLGIVIPDVSDFVTKSVNDLVNYYLKSETYTKTETNDLISAITTLNIEVVEVLPTQDISTTTIYLVPKSTSETNNIYDEYVYVSNSWEKIGDTQIDLSNYVTISDLNTALANYTTTTDLTTLLNAKQDVRTVTTSSTSTYTISNLVGNTTYKLGEVTNLTINTITTFDDETVIYFESGTTATVISVPASLENLGDYPTFTTLNDFNIGTCDTSKKYIISILNNVAVWKAY